MKGSVRITCINIWKTKPNIQKYKSKIIIALSAHFGK